MARWHEFTGKYWPVVYGGILLQNRRRRCQNTVIIVAQHHHRAISCVEDWRLKSGAAVTFSRLYPSSALSLHWLGQ